MCRVREDSGWTAALLHVLCNFISYVGVGRGGPHSVTLRDYSWPSLGAIKRCQGLNCGWSCARQVPLADFNTQEKTYVDGASVDKQMLFVCEALAGSWGIYFFPDKDPM